MNFFESYLEKALNEGMSNFPDNMADVKKLAKLMEEPILSNDIQDLFNLIDDDGLHDIIASIEHYRIKDGMEPQDVRSYVQAFIKEMYKRKDSFFEPIDEKVWKELLKLANKKIR